MSASARLRPAPHGSPAGFEQGCTTALGCPNLGSAEVLTCVDAATRRRGDWSLRRLPLDQPLRVLQDVAPTPHAEQPEVHGTPWGYRRGCRDRSSCPNWRRGGFTCTDARARYLEDYRRRRVSGEGSSIEHGTLAGYHAGCRDEARCGGAALGTTCSEARRRYKLERARRAGIRPAPLVDDPTAAARAVQRWAGSGRSIREIARMTGVARDTVLALAEHDRSGSPRRFTTTTVQRVLAVEAGRDAR